MNSWQTDDTIAALATMPGDSGISIVRVSGKGALAVADAIFLSKSGKKPSTFKTFTVHYGWIALPPSNIIDEVILTVMRSPHSYTREDVVEINCHGGMIASRQVLEVALASGARVAEPGEFTKRAFLNGRIDLAQAEAVIDIIRAKTDSSLNLGMEQLKGALSDKIKEIRNSIIEVLSELEAEIDFPEDVADAQDHKKLRPRLAAIIAEFDSLIENARRGQVLRDGVHTVICGRPNVGKSSLLNALLRKERSIVTPIAGTTRDIIEEVIDIKGVSLCIVDTAGILEPRDLVEKKAVERTRRQIELADLVLFIFDGTRCLSKEDIVLLKKLKKKNIIAVINKIDLKQKLKAEKLAGSLKRVVAISAKKMKNIGALEDEIVEAACGARISPYPQMICNLRHLEALKAGQKLIAEALNSLDNNLSCEFIAEDLRGGLLELDRILGKDFSEDLLDSIFSKFCIGK